MVWIRTSRGRASRGQHRRALERERALGEDGGRTVLGGVFPAPQDEVEVGGEAHDLPLAAPLGFAQARRVFRAFEQVEELRGEDALGHGGLPPRRQEKEDGGRRRPPRPRRRAYFAGSGAGAGAGAGGCSPLGLASFRPFGTNPNSRIVWLLGPKWPRRAAFILLRRSTPRCSSSRRFSLVSRRRASKISCWLWRPRAPATQDSRSPQPFQGHPGHRSRRGPAQCRST